LLFAGFVLYQSNYLGHYIETQGTVIDLKVDEEGAAAPVVRLITQNGQEVIFTGKTASNPPAHTIGQTVTVRYSPNRPDQASIKGESNLFMIVFGVVGAILFGVGVVALVLGW
ncbi:MAG: DUF3592 domain-containing protein, partial [Chloroflexus sp.]